MLESPRIADHRSRRPGPRYEQSETFRRARAREQREAIASLMLLAFCAGAALAAFVGLCAPVPS